MARRTLHWTASFRGNGSPSAVISEVIHGLNKLDDANSNDALARVFKGTAG